MSWIALAIACSFFLGLAEVFKKLAVRDNAVLAVIFFATIPGVILWLPIILFSSFGFTLFGFKEITGIATGSHLLIMLKSGLVSLSWLFGYKSLKHLPASTVGIIRTSGPFWTIIIVVVVMGEMPSVNQWVGISIILFGFVGFAVAGRRLGGLRHFASIWFIFALAATVLGSLSSILDKYLIQFRGVDPIAVQAWFSVYSPLSLAPIILYWRWSRQVKGENRNTLIGVSRKATIFAIGLSLSMADFLYFHAIGIPDSLMSVIAPIRRMSVLIPFLFGIYVLGERDYILRKSIFLAILLLGSFYLLYSGT